MLNEKGIPIREMYEYVSLYVKPYKYDYTEARVYIWL